MDANEFWCRAFLAAMSGTYAQEGSWDNHECPANYCERSADAALAVAQRRGMVAAASMDPLRRAARRWILAARANNTDDFDAAEADLVKAAEALVGDPAPGPTLERVEFTAEPSHGDPDLWAVCIKGVDKTFYVCSGEEHPGGLSLGMRIKWNESAPPKPIEVWIDRSAR